MKTAYFFFSQKQLNCLKSQLPSIPTRGQYVYLNYLKIGDEMIQFTEKRFDEDVKWPDSKLVFSGTCDSNGKLLDKSIELICKKD